MCNIIITSKVFYLLSAFILFTVVITLIKWDQILDSANYRTRYDINSEGFLVNTPGCVIPDVDPFDPTVIRLYSPKHPLVCKGLPPLVAVDYQKLTIELDQQVANRNYKENPASLNCTYRAIQRDSSSRSDNKIIIDRASRSLGLDGAVRIEHEFIYIQCRNHWGKEIYSDYVPFIQKKPKVEKRVLVAKQRNRKSVRLGIILLGIDSVSRLNFIRHFPLTRRYLLEEMNAVQLLGYTKVGDNTFPNMIPMLTGRDADQVAEIGSNPDKPFDSLNLIWKNFSAGGYRTFYAEEIPTISAFNYLKTGFHGQPTDYYYRPFTLATETSSMKRRSSENCFNRRMEVDVVLRWLNDYLQTFKNESLFSLTFVSRITHDNLNAAGWADRPYRDFLRNAHTDGLFDNSILFFFSDHGIRFGAIRDTYIGKLEERLPFHYVVLPKWFPKTFPTIWKNLLHNQKRLTTPFDIYATMTDVLQFDGSEGGYERPNPTTHRDLSLFRRIPGSRTCSDAAILPHWCVCHERRPGNLTNAKVKAAAQELVKEINKKLLAVRKWCAISSLKQLLDVRVSSLSQNVLSFKSGAASANDFGQLSRVYDYLLTLSLSPSDGVFEGTVRYKESVNEFQVMNPISRISAYGNQSYCVNSTELRLFCYCLT